MNPVLVLLTFLFQLALVQCASSVGIVPVQISDSFLISSVDRVIDLSRPSTSSIDSTLKIKSKDASRKFMLSIPSDLTDVKLAFISAKGSSSESGNKQDLTVVKTVLDSEKQLQYFVVELPSINIGDYYYLSLHESFLALAKPYPKEIEQFEDLKLLYTGNVYFESPYFSESQKTSIKLRKSSILDYTKLEKVSKKDGLVYGPFESVKPFSVDLIKVHYQNNDSPLLVKNRETTYELSFLGHNLAVEEHYDLVHSGALLKGYFSRMDYMIDFRKAATAPVVTEINFLVPQNAKHFFFRDNVGNVSTSKLSYSSKGSLLTLTPRFPLFGGWKYFWMHGFNVPLTRYVSKLPNGNFIAKIPFFDKPLTDLAVLHNNIKIILPEGASIVNVKTPFEIKQARGTHYTYLDSVGRPFISFKKENVVSEHAQDVEIEFKLPFSSLWYKPLVCAFAYFLVFVSVMTYSRLDLSIKQDPATLKVEKQQYLVIQTKKLVLSIKKSLDQLENLFTDYKKTKNADKFKNQRSSIENRVNSEISKLELVANEANSIQFATLVNELTAIVSRLKETLANQKKKHGDAFALFKDLQEASVDDEKKKAVLERMQRVDDDNSALSSLIDAALLKLEQSI